jgi:hypothetical protein
MFRAIETIQTARVPRSGLNSCARFQIRTNNSWTRSSATDRSRVIRRKREKTIGAKRSYSAAVASGSRLLSCFDSIWSSAVMLIRPWAQYCRQNPLQSISTNAFFGPFASRAACLSLRFSPLLESRSDHIPTSSDRNRKRRASLFFRFVGLKYGQYDPFAHATQLSEIATAKARGSQTRCANQAPAAD